MLSVWSGFWGGKKFFKIKIVLAWALGIVYIVYTPHFLLSSKDHCATRRPVHQKICNVLRTDVTRFEEIHPQHGAYAWFVRECMSRYISLYNTTPSDNLNETVQSVFDSAQKKVRDRED